MRKFNRDINQKIVNFWRRSLHSQWLPLLVWIAIATCLRLTNLDGKPPWADEFSTLVFSLGNSFQDVPLDRAIAPEILLQPLQFNVNTDINNVVDNLLTHSNHPPVYFILTHWWMQFFSTEGEFVSLWGARSLSVIFGVVSIPAIYGLARLAFHSRLVGQFAAAIMAVSPYGIYLAQEARHYTLVILFVIASFSCLTISIRHFQQGQSLSIFTAFIWVVVNSLGIATHYFFTLTLCAEAMVLISLFLWKVFVEGGRRKKLMGTQTSTNFKYPVDDGLLNSKEKVEEGRIKKEEEKKSFDPILLFIRRGNSKFLILNSKFLNFYTLIKSLASFYILILGTLAGGLVWLPFWKNGYSSELTKWIAISDSNLKNLLSPIFQFLATWITMLFLLPIESPIFPIAIISVVVMILFFIWLFPLFIRSTINCLKKSDISLSLITFAGVILASTLLFFGFTYIFGIDLTRGARYSFVYFPAVIILVAAILAQIFNRQFVKSKFFNLSICTTTGKKAVMLILLMALLSGLTVVSNLGYQKYYRPDLFVSLIEKKSDKPIVIATAHYTHVETGELMGIAWNMRKKNQQKCRKESICQEKHLEGVKFILVEQKTDIENTVDSLYKIINRLKYPFDLWLVNFASDFNTTVENCQIDKGEFPLIDGYKYQLYHCYYSGV